MNNKIKVIFTISIIANIFFMGLISGHVFKSYKFMSKFYGAENNISLANKDLIKEAFKDNRDEMRKIFKRIKLNKKSLGDIFVAKEFDGDAYDTQVEELMADHAELSKYKYKIFKDLAMKLPQEERKELSHKLLLRNFNSTNRNRNKSHHFGGGSHSFLGRNH